MEYNLEERTVKFSENIIDLLKSIRLNSINKSIINQLVMSAASVGALITAKLTEPVQKKISKTKYIFARKK